MVKMRLILSISACIIFASVVQAQEGVCGTEVTPAQITLENNSIAIPSVKASESPSHLNTEISVTVYIIKDENGADGITLAAINAAFDRLNAAFSPVKLKLRVCNTVYVENYQFNTINALQNERDLTIKHHSPNTVNLYFASVVIDKSGNNVSGYTHMPAEQKDFIFLKKVQLAEAISSISSDIFSICIILMKLFLETNLLKIPIVIKQATDAATLHLIRELQE